MGAGVRTGGEEMAQAWGCRPDGIHYRKGGHTSDLRLSWPPDLDKHGWKSLGWSGFQGDQGRTEMGVLSVLW